MSDEIREIAKDVLAYTESGEEPPYKEEVVVLAKGVLGLLDLLRWRDAWGEPPTEHGNYLVHRYAFYGDSEIMTLHWNGSWPMRAITHWRPIGPMPGGE